MNISEKLLGAKVRLLLDGYVKSKGSAGPEAVEEIAFRIDGVSSFVGLRGIGNTETGDWQLRLLVQLRVAMKLMSRECGLRKSFLWSYRTSG